MLYLHILCPSCALLSLGHSPPSSTRHILPRTQRRISGQKKESAGTKHRCYLPRRLHLLRTSYMLQRWWLVHVSSDVEVVELLRWRRCRQSTPDMECTASYNAMSNESKKGQRYDSMINECTREDRKRGDIATAPLYGCTISRRTLSTCPSHEYSWPA